MPLPPAPKKRAARLSPDQSEAATPAAKTRATAPTAKTSADKTSAASAATTAAAQGLAELRAQGAATPTVATAPAAAPKTAATATVTATVTAAAAARPAAASADHQRSAPKTEKKEAVSASNNKQNSNKTIQKPSKRGAKRCLFVLDTNVLLHDPTCLFRFQEHDIFLPMVVLEELDSHKRGGTEVARNGRQVSRTLDALVEAHKNTDLAAGLKLDATGTKGVTGQLFFQTVPLHYTLPLSLPQGKADNQILGVVQALREQESQGREVLLVSKDINMRVKARALGLPAEDYQNDKALDDDDLLYSGALALPADFWSRHGKAVESWQSGPNTFYRVSGPMVAQIGRAHV